MQFGFSSAPIKEIAHIRYPGLLPTHAYVSYVAHMRVPVASQRPFAGSAFYALARLPVLRSQ